MVSNKVKNTAVDVILIDCPLMICIIFTGDQVNYSIIKINQNTKIDIDNLHMTF